jgi:hypothetical protein
MTKQKDPSKNIYFHTIVDEFAASLTNEFGIEIDPDLYDRKVKNHSETSISVQGIYNDLYEYVQQFVMRQLQRRAPRENFKFDKQKVADIVLSITEDLRRIAGIDDFEEVPTHSDNKQNSSNISIKNNETLAETILRVEEALRNAEMMLIKPKTSLQI